jgi:hypothetical protein
MGKIHDEDLPALDVVAIGQGSANGNVMNANVNMNANGNVNVNLSAGPKRSPALGLRDKHADGSRSLTLLNAILGLDGSSGNGHGGGAGFNPSKKAVVVKSEEYKFGGSKSQPPKTKSKGSLIKGSVSKLQMVSDTETAMANSGKRKQSIVDTLTVSAARKPEDGAFSDS